MRATPEGLVVRPRVRAASWFIEAAVWLIGAGVAASLLTLGSEDWMRVLGAVLLLPIGLRALVRTIRFLASTRLRTLTVAYRSSFPRVAGPFAQAALPVAAVDLVTERGDRYLSVVGGDGRRAHLVTLEPSDDRAYRELASWMEAQGMVRRPGWR